MIPIFDDPQIVEDSEASLETTRQFLYEGVDHLCCGRFGRIETLLNAGVQFSCPSLIQDAEQAALYLAKQASDQGGYRLFANLPRSVKQFGIFQGLCGIGYELLRIAHPALFPSILLWDTHISPSHRAG